MARILLSLLIFVSILFFPFWLTIPMALLGIIYFNFYWEAVFLFLISDLMFGIKESRFLGITIISSVFILVIMLITEFIKRKLKFYDK